MTRESLPIDDVMPQILEHLLSAGMVVLKAEPGAGKTTRVPPAMLDAGLAELPNKRMGQIIVLQPRRVAARAAATRISEERGTEVGESIGYQVRYERRASRNTRILVCTEGIFLRQLQDDPFLENTAAVVFDEFHERSVDSDIALAMIRQVRETVRPDLRIVVMSATLDTAPVARYLGGCPTVECPGRSYPIDIEYLPFPPTVPTERLASDGVKRMLARTAGHMLVFLPGVGEIRQTQALLESTAADEALLLMPLFGDMPLEEQQRVLRPCPQRKIVLATNVAETSLTIGGVSVVVDTGLARVNRLDPQLGLNRLEVARISRASADQRAGRAGRTGAGICLRLWSEREQHMMRDFDIPEIARVELSQCLLQLLAWGEHNIAAFPWFESPPAAALERALQLLERLDVLEGGRLTDLGRRVARLPLQPRLARLLVEGEQFGQARRAALCAAMLAERDPFRRSGASTKAEYHSDSDVLERMAAIEDFANTGLRDSAVGELLPGPAKQILRASEQLVRLTREREPNQAGTQHKAVTVHTPPAKLSSNSDEPILRALLTAFPDRVCRRREPRGRRALMVGGRGVRLAEESGVGEAELFVAVELMDSGQSESLVRQASRVERSWLPQSHLTTTIDMSFDAARERVTATRRLRFCDLVLEEIPVSLPPEIDCGAVLAEAVAARFDLASLVDDDAKQYLARVQCLREWLPQLNLPEFGPDAWRELLPQWCAGCASVEELRSRSLISAIQSRLTAQQIAEVDREAPDRIVMPGGRRIKLDYETGKAPVLAVRIQELFGIRETPRIARSQVGVLLHLLAPNYRVQQITPDLASFWKNTYLDVRKQLKARYPKHSWPEDPLSP